MLKYVYIYLQTAKDDIPEKTDNRTENQDLQKIDEIDIQI